MSDSAPPLPSTAAADTEPGPAAHHAAIVAHFERPGAGAWTRLAVLALGLEERLRRIVVVGAGADGAERLAPGLLAVHVPAGRSPAMALAAGVQAALDRDPVEGLVVVGDGILDWTREELELVEARALELVVGAAGVAGWLSSEPSPRLRPGVALCSRAAWEELGAPAAAVLRGERSLPAPGPRRLDLRALARLLELGVPVAATPPELAVGLSRWRERWSGSATGLGGRLHLDEAEFPAAVAAGEVPLSLQGWIARLPQPDRLELRVGERRVEVSVSIPRPDVLAAFPELAHDRCGFRWRGTLGGLAPGRHRVALGLPGRRAARRLGFVEVRGEARERPAAPLLARFGLGALAARRKAPAPGSLVVERVAAVPEAGKALRLELEGVLTLVEPVDSLALFLDDAETAVLDPRALAPRPVPPGEPPSWAFRISAPLVARAGSLRLRLAARRHGATSAEWRGALPVPDLESPVAIASPPLERLRRDSPALVHGALVVEGALLGAPRGAEVALELDGGAGARSALDADGGFRLVRRLDEGERAEGECVARLGGAELARSGRFAAVGRRFEIDARDVAALEGVLGALAPHAPALRDAPAEGLLRAAFEMRPAERGAIEAALAALSANLAEHAPPREPDSLAGPLPARPLRVLFVSWEIPWSGHGGGVCMVNLLRRLGARGAGHAITLLHPTFPGAEGLSEEVREDVREILTVPRGWRAPAEPAPYGTPEPLLRTWSPELAGAIAAELGSGSYDLANFEYFGAGLHAPPLARVPDLLAFYESAAFALAATTPERFADEHAAAARLLDLVRALHFEAVLVPARFPRMVSLTDPEADLLRRFAPRLGLTVNPIPIDVARLARAAARAPRVERPTFLFLGSYRHAPNLEAARRLVEEVAPRLRAALPGCRIVLAGDRAPLELVEAARRAGLEHLGWVDDPPLLLGGATAFVAPISSGAGMRVKHLEAMACGCPVVTTPLGMSGIAAAAGRDFLAGESAEELAAAAVRLAREPDLRERIVDSARALVERDHAPEVQGDRRAEIWGGVLAGAARD